MNRFFKKIAFVPFPPSLSVPAVLGVFLWTFLSCGAPAGPLKSPDGPFPDRLEGKSNDRVVARVNGQAIIHSEVEQLLRERVPRFSGHRRLSESRMGELYDQAVEELIEKELILQEGKRMGIKIEKGEIEEEIQKIKSRFSDPKDYRQALDRERLTEEEVRLGVAEHLLVRKTLSEKIEKNILIPEDDLERYYTGHMEQFIIPEQVRLRQILLMVEPGAPSEAWEEARQQAVLIVREARNGGDFSELARRYSDDEKTRDRGGDLGFFHRGQLSPKAVEDAAYGLEVGEVSGPIQTFMGFYIVRLEDRKPQRQLEFSEVNRDLLRHELFRSAFVKRKEDWLKGLRKGAEIKKF